MPIVEDAVMQLQRKVLQMCTFSGLRTTLEMTINCLCSDYDLSTIVYCYLKCRLIWQGTNSSGQQAIVFACLPVSIKAFLKLKRVCLCIISQDDCAAAEVTGVSSDGVAHSKRHRSRSPGIRWSTASQPVRPSAVVNAKWRSGTIPKRRSLLFRSLKLFEGP